MNACSSFWITNQFLTFTEYFGSSTFLNDTEDDASILSGKFFQWIKIAFTCCYRNVTTIDPDQQSQVEYVELQGLNTVLPEKLLQSSVSSLSSLEDDKIRRGRQVLR